MRRFSIVLTIIGAVITPAATALAGGSWMEPYRESYRPDDTVVMRGDVSPGQLGWIDDGPFYAYLRVDPAADRAAETANRFPFIHETDVPLGELEINERSDGWLAVALTFTVPADIPDGEYWVVYCNDPCTEGLGDLIGGWISVKTPRAPAPPRRACFIAFSAIHPV